MFEKILKESLCRRVWEIFFDICKIPRPSGSEEKISLFIKDFAHKNQIELEEDKSGNLLLKKGAQSHKQNSPILILQAHMDMVPQKDPDSSHNFLEDPLEIKIENNLIKANMTTLGADNGIGLALALAILEDKNLSRPALEVLFTVDEERGLSGALNLKANWLKGESMINLDSEDEGKFIIGCAGGQDTSAIFEYQESLVDPDTTFFRLRISGLIGGHSGVDIHLGRGNANKILGKLLNEIGKECDLSLADISGGDLRNAIPRESFALFCLPKEQINRLEEIVSNNAKIVKQNFSKTDPGLKISLEPAPNIDSALTKEDSLLIVKALSDCPDGVLSWSQDFKQVVETSSNLGIIKKEAGYIEIATLQRSLDDKKRDESTKKVASFFSSLGGRVNYGKPYPGWKPNPSSKLLDKTKDAYLSLFKKEPIVEVIHAGLECGIIGSAYPKIDMISCGPTIKSPHSPSESLDISSTERIWLLLKSVLEQ